MKEQKWALWFSGNEKNEPSWMQDSDGVVFVFDTAEDAKQIRDELLSGEEEIKVKPFPVGELPTRPFFEPKREEWD